MKGPTIYGSYGFVLIEQPLKKLMPDCAKDLERVALNVRNIEAIRPSVPPKDVYIDIVNGNSYKIPDTDFIQVVRAYKDAMK